MGTIVARTVVETSPKMSHYQILTNVNKQLTFIGCKQTTNYDIGSINVNKQLTMIPKCKQTANFLRVNVNKQLTFIG